MMNKRLLKSTVALVIISALTLTGCSSSDKELAKVGDYVITQQMINKEVKPYIDSQKELYPDTTKAELDEYEDELQKSMLQYLSEVEALCLEAKKNNFTVEQKVLDESYDYAVGEVEYYFNMEMEDFCKKYNFDLEYVKESINKQTLASNYLFDGAIKLSDESIATYYKENKEAFKMIKASHILISNENEYLPEDATYEEDGTHTHNDGTKHQTITKEENEELAKIKHENFKKAEDILVQAKNGIDFTALSDKYSDDTEAKKNGGDLGYFTVGTMVAEFEDAAFDENLKNNEIYNKVVETMYGYHIIKKIDEKYQTLEEATPDIENILLEDELEKYLEQLRKDYGIVAVSETLQ